MRVQLQMDWGRSLLAIVRFCNGGSHERLASENFENLQTNDWLARIKTLT
jgi:hypothetical protein